MRKSFTRLFGLFILFVSLISFQVVAQGATWVTGLSPADGSCAASRSGDYVISFDRNVFPNGLGVFGISNSSGTEQITMQIPATFAAGTMEFSGTQSLHGGKVMNWRITFNGKQVTINLSGEQLAAYTAYYITVSEDAVKDASGNLFAGLDENGTVSMTPCASNNVQDWDFTTMRDGEFRVTAFDPKDGSDNVSTLKGTGSNYFSVTFDRPIYWAVTNPSTGVPTKTQGSPLGASWLKDGYFALYTYTDLQNGQIGGDVVAHQLSYLNITDNVLTFAFSDGYPLAGNSEFYLRVRPGIIADQYWSGKSDDLASLWDGVNTNNEWNWTTKDGAAAYVDAIAWEASCPPVKGTIKITFKDRYKSGSSWVPTDADVYVVSDPSSVPAVKEKLTSSNKTKIKEFITINDGALDFDVTSVTESGNDVIVVITPKTNMTSNTDYTVKVSNASGVKQLWDASNELITGKSQKLTSKDYDAPNTTATVTANADGTTFDILGRMDEPGDIYYIVVADTSFKISSTTYTEADLIKDSNRGAIFAADTIGARGYKTLIVKDGTTPVTANIYVWAAGIINVEDAALTYHERITGLPQTHGRYYRVIFFASDDACSGSNSIVNVGSSKYKKPYSNISSIQNREQATLDILPPYIVEWRSDLKDASPVGTSTSTAINYTGCVDQDADGISGIKRMGAIYVKMNESVEKAAGWGNAIAASDIPGIFTVYDNGTQVLLDAAACSYDEATFTFKLVPRYAFHSNADVDVVLNANRIQDRQDNVDFGPNGTELLDMDAESFCVEYYAGPVAVCDITKANYWSPSDSAVDVDEDEVIKFVWDQKLYVPTADEAVSGVVQEPSNTITDNTWIGNYIRILSGSSYTAAQTGSIVHQSTSPNYELFDFKFENTAAGAVITVELKPGKVFNSETWYYFEVEPALKSVEGYTLDWDISSAAYGSCAPSNYWMVFQSEDNRHPVCLFYEDNDLLAANGDLGLLDGKTNVDSLSYIKVQIDEWVSLGFDGFKDLEATDTIEDANALRPYFTLKNSAGENIRFDVKQFSIDYGGDMATFYIDPYEQVPGTIKESPNFIEGANDYQVCFLGASTLLNPAYEGDSILFDDNENGVGRTCATFDVYQIPDPYTCLIGATLNNKALDLVTPIVPIDLMLTSDSTLTLAFQFGGPMNGVAGRVISIVSGGSTIATVNAGTFITKSSSTIVEYSFDMHGVAEWVNNADFEIRIDQDSAMVNTSTPGTDYECVYPTTNNKLVSTFHTIDGTNPVITAFVPDIPYTGTCLTDKDVTDIIITFDEEVVPQSGKRLEIWRYIAPATTTLIASVDATSATYQKVGNTTYKNILVFETGQLYNGNTQEICDKLVYGGSYFFQIPEGFVKNNVGLTNAGIVADPTHTADSLTFCVGPDPVPTIDACGVTAADVDVAPFGANIESLKPIFSIKFSEPVQPVPGKRIQVSENITTNAVFGFDVSLMTTTNGGLTYTLASADLLPNAAYPNFKNFEFGSCYYVNVDSAAFVDRSNALNRTDKIVTFRTDAEPTTYGCPWWFCVNDTKGPEVQLWPNNKDISIPVNAHLYAYIAETGGEPWVDTTVVGTTGTLLPLVTGGHSAAEAQQFFNISWVKGANSGTLTSSQWKLEFVGTDKKHLRITVFDPLGYDFSAQDATNPVMQAEARYTLSFNPTSVAGNVLCDSLGNPAVAKSIYFDTEDITDPVIIAGLSGDSTRITNCGSSPNKLIVKALINESGYVKAEVYRGSTLLTSTDWIAAATASSVNFKTKNDISITLPTDPVEGQYNVTVKLYAKDNEEDLYDTDAECEATWMWAGSTLDNFDGESYDRIRDFLPAPNVIDKSHDMACTLCDDDKPYIVWDKCSPKFNGTALAVNLNDSIKLYFNETVLITDNGGGQGQGYSIWLRDYENNIGVPMAYRIKSEGKDINNNNNVNNVIMLYPLDSAQVIGIDNQFQPYAMSTSPVADLASERKYYLEIDRYAVSDDGGCSGNNYADEIVGKTYWFKTKDATPPCLAKVEPMNTDPANLCGVGNNADIRLTFTETNTLSQNALAVEDSNYVYIYRLGNYPNPHELLPISNATFTRKNETSWYVDLTTHLQFRSGETYIVYVPFRTFKDSYNNVWSGCLSSTAITDGVSTDANGAYWTFTVEDYLSPVPSWTVFSHQDYLDVVLEDDQYEMTVKSGVVGDVYDRANPIPTTSYLKVEFDEEVFVKNPSIATPATFKTLKAGWDLQASGTWDYVKNIYNLVNIKVKESGDIGAFTNLVKPTINLTGSSKGYDWTKAYDFVIDSVSDDSRALYLTIHQGTRQWSPLFTTIDTLTLGSKTHYGLKSNSDYQVDLTGGIIYDDELCDGSRLVMGNVDNLVTMVTRDDIPPVLTYFDGETEFTATQKAIKGMNSNPSSDLVKCISAEGPLTLQFDSRVVKTPYAGIGYDPLAGGWLNDGINWYTEANLPLQEKDLINPDSDNDFLQVYKLEGVSLGTSSTTPKYKITYTSKTAVALKSVKVYEVDGKTTVDLNWLSKLTSSGYYQVNFLGGTVKDTKRIPNGNVFLGDSVIFRVEDYLGPELISPLAGTPLRPANDPNGANTISPDFTGKGLWMTFDQPILKGEGTLELRWMNGQQDTLISINSCVTDDDYVVGNTNSSTSNDNILYVPLNTVLDDFEGYYVIVPEGFVTDINECDLIPSEAINEDEDGYKEWVFYTSDATPPVAQMYIPNNTRDENGNIISVNDSVATGSDLSIIFDENIKVGACGNGGLFLYHNDLLDGFSLGSDFGNFIEFIPFNDPTIEISGTDMYHGKTRNMITFNPKTTFEKKGIYYVRVSEAAAGGACGIYDDAGNGWFSKKTDATLGDANFANDTIAWSFVVSNDVAPMLATKDPAYDHDNNPNVYAPCFVANDSGYVVASLNMTFTEDGTVGGTPVPVAPLTGWIKIMEYRYNPVKYTYEEKLWKTFDVNDENVVFNGNAVTINNVLLRDQINGIDAAGKHEFYYVLIERGAIINAYPGSTTEFLGIKDAFEWRFKTCADDKFVEGYEILSPNINRDGDAAKNLPITAVNDLKGPYADTLMVRFNEGIEALSNPNGKVTIFNVTDNKVAEEIVINAANIASGKVKIEGLKLTIVADSLKDEKSYYVEIGTEALGDTSTVSTPNDYVIGGATKWAFTTGDNTKPAPIATTPNTGCQKADVTLSMQFAENFGVALAEGSIVIKDAAGNTIVTKTTADATVNESNKNIVTIPVKDLPDSTDLTVEVPAGFVVDNGNNHLPNEAFSWSFRTGENRKPTLVDFAPAEILGSANTTLVFTFSEVVSPVAAITVATEGQTITIPADSFVVDPEDAKVWSVAVAGLNSETTYNVTIPAGAFKDVNANCEANLIDEVSRTITVGDITVPEALYTPDGITLPDYVDLTLTINFNDEVTKVAGKKVTVYNAVTNEVKLTIDANEFTPAEGNKTYSYLTSNLGYGSFYVLVEEGAFVDNSAQEIGKIYAGVTSVDEWTFSVVDPSFSCNDPEIITPQRGTPGVQTTTTISISFCQERIKAGVGFVTVGDQSPNQVEGVNFWNFDAEDFIIEGSKLTINVTGLQELTTYSIIIAPGAIVDEAGNAFAGIIDANKWWFTTGDFTKPVVTVENVSVNNVNGKVNVTSNELGTVYIAKTDVEGNVTAIVAAITANKAKQAPVVAANTAVEFSTAGLVAGTYKAYAVDATGNFGASETTFEVTDVPMLTIKAIQGEKDASPYDTKLVATKGTVTALSADGKGYFIQDANAAWSGIYIYDPSRTGVKIGSDVKVVGTASEYNNLTEIKDLLSFDFVGSIITPEPIVLSNIADANAEKYEGVLVKIEGVEVNALPDTYKEWKVARPTGTVVIIDDQCYPYTPVMGHYYNVTGVVNFTYNDYKIAPRIAADIVDLWVLGNTDLATAIKVYPNPFDKYIKLNVASDVKITKAVITNIAGQLIKEVINPDNTIPTSELRSGVYVISLHTVDGIAKAERIIKR